MEKEYIDPQDIRGKFRYKSDMWSRLTVDCKHWFKVYLFSGYSSTFLFQMPNSVLETGLIRGEEVSYLHFALLSLLTMKA